MQSFSFYWSFEIPPSHTEWNGETMLVCESVIFLCIGAFLWQKYLDKINIPCDNKEVTSVNL